MKTAIVIGGTGLVGSHLISLLEQHPGFGVIKIIGRRKPVQAGVKSIMIQTDFEDLSLLQQEVHGDVLFSCLGTTLKKAGSKEAQFKVDYTFQLRVAEVAAQNKVPKYVLVSSVGAHANSRLFYSKIKGQLEHAVNKLSFDHITIIRPSILVGKREDSRLGEQVGLMLSQVLQVLPGLRKYRAIQGNTVAKAMLVAAQKSDGGRQVYESDALFLLATEFKKIFSPAVA